MISVLIPTYNSAAYLGEALESVLRQTTADFEIIVVDDGSTDETRQIVESFSQRIKYFYQENAGIGAARNLCVKQATGELLAFLDADDVWTTNKLELQLREFAKDNALEAIFGMVKQVSASEWTKEIVSHSFSGKEFFKGFCPGTMLVKRESFLRVGWFLQDHSVGEFLDWFLRAKEEKLKIKLLPDLLMLRRVHLSNSTIRQPQAIQDYAKILKSSIDRRRGRLSKTDL